MLAPIARRLREVAALARAVHHKVRCGAVALARYLGLAIGQELDIASQDDLDSRVHTAVALGQCGLGLLSNLCDSLPPGLPRGILDVQRGHLFPGELFSCYHSTDLHSYWKVVVPGRWGGTISSAAVVLRHGLLLLWGARGAHLGLQV